MKIYVILALLASVSSCGRKTIDATEPSPVPPAQTATPPADGGAAPPVADLDPANSADLEGKTTVALNFLSRVQGEAVVCAPGGSDAIQRGQIFADIRMFMSNVAFVAKDGRVVPLELNVERDSRNLQFVDGAGNSVALLNFLEPSCASSDATVTVKDSISGSLPSGEYTEIHFQLGLPYPARDARLVAMPAALAPSDMGWMWSHFPADVQIEAKDGSTRKMMNVLTSGRKTTIALPYASQVSGSKKNIKIALNLEQLFRSTAATYLQELEGACNNKTQVMSENAPHCAHAFKALGLEVAAPSAPYQQTVFAIAE